MEASNKLLFFRTSKRQHTEDDLVCTFKAMYSDDFISETTCSHSAKVSGFDTCTKFCVLYVSQYFNAFGL